MSVILRQWDVVKVRVNPEDRDEHPAIILSSDEVAGGRWPKINVIYGTTKRPADKLLPGQVLLCVFFPVVRKTAISKKLGSVSANRRRILHQTIAGALRLFQ